MSYKTIVVHLDAARRRAERLDIACRVAAAFDAHLVGLFALSAIPVPFALGAGAGAVISAEAKLRAEAAEEARAEFERAAAMTRNSRERDLLLERAANAYRH